MKATGIVRRIDDLGRVVIPKEIRRTLKIKEGEPLEIFTENGGSVIFKKYSPAGEQSELAMQLCEAVSKTCSRGFVICDRDSIIAVSGGQRLQLDGKSISPELEEIMQSRHLQQNDDGFPIAANMPEIKGVIAAPIIAGGDLCGCAVFLSSEAPVGDTEVKIAQTAALLFAKQMEF